MAMRIDLAFARPLSRGERLRLVLAIGTQAKAERVTFGRGDRTAVVLGEGLSSARLLKLLTEEGFVCETITSSLTPEEDQRMDDLPGAPAEERVKPLGRNHPEVRGSDRPRV